MESTELKDKMKKLWKDTFHDSDSYISLIFDNYFNPEFVEYHEENGKLISALMGVPYVFGNGRNSFKGLYLCGLATLDEYRHRGIMHGLIERINLKAKEHDMTISFLIPASDMLRIYYQGKGYVNGMYRVEERYTDIHNFDNDSLIMINNEEEHIRHIRLKQYENISVIRSADFDDDLRYSIVKYIISNETRQHSFVSLVHSSDDTINMLRENLLSGGEIMVAKDQEGKVVGVVFVTFGDRRRIIIPKIYYDDKYIYYKLLSKVKSVYSESAMSVMRFPEETDRHALWSKVYGASNPDGGMLGGAYGVAERVYNAGMHAQAYGMVRILNLHEILKFVANDRADVKYSILVKDENSGETGMLYKVSKGDVKKIPLSGEEFKDAQRNPNITVLTMRDISEIIFRRKDGNSLIMEAFGIPRLAINMALLLD